MSFFRLPYIRRKGGKKDYELSRKRETGYLAAIPKDLSKKDLSQVRICSRHFLTGKPASYHDTLNPDWLPTQYLTSSTKNSGITMLQRQARYYRQKARESKECIAISEQIDNKEPSVQLSNGALDNPTPVTDNSSSVIDNSSPVAVATTDMEGTNDACTQTDGISIDEVRCELNVAYENIRHLKSQIASLTFFTESSFQSQSNSFIQHYTGLPNFQVVKTVYNFVSSSSKFGNTKLTPFQEYVMILMKLRLNPSLQDLAYRFGIHYSTVSKILLKWLTIMDVRLSPLIIWPEREELKKTMPESFRSEFGYRVSVVLDCFEVFIERPSNLLARACTWSSYKHHNTVKFLIGIAPQGVISYISSAWGGRVSDKFLTEHCGILNKLLPEDIVLADRGFDIADSVSAFRAQLHIPTFTKGKNQLSTLEVEETRSIANVRIHVERVIGNVRQKFSILRGTIPINMVTKRTGEECPLIDRIVRICCALCNVCTSVVPFD